MKYQWASSKKQGFTIVELLIVIVIIGILAAITIVAYNGIQDRARISSVSSALSQSAKKLKLYQVDNPDTYPVAAGSNGLDNLATLGITNTSDVTYQYSSSANTYCLTATNGTTSYKISNTSATPTAGGCAGHGVGGVAAVTNLAIKPYPKSGSGAWTGYSGAGGVTMAVSPNSNGTRAAWRMTSGAAGISTSATVGFGYQGADIVVSPGMTVWPSIYVQSNKAGTYTLFCQFFNVTVQTGLCPASNVSVPANTWVRLGGSSVTVPASTDRMNIRAQYVSGTTWVSGDWIDATMVSTASGGYADGDSTDWVWNGTANNSTSTGPAQ